MKAAWLGLAITVAMVVASSAATSSAAPYGYSSSTTVDWIPGDQDPTRYVVGVNTGRNTVRGPRAAASLGARLVRIEWEIGTPPERLDGVVAAYWKRGVRIQPLAGFYGRVPSSAEAMSLRAWALRFGPGGSFWKSRKRPLPITRIEFGNETSYGHQYGDSAGDTSYAERARTYGARGLEAARSLGGTGVGLLVQADDGGSNRTTWVDEMLGAAPELNTLARGWVVHPYGPLGFERIRRMLASLVSHGMPIASIRVFITEWGLSSDNGRELSDNYGYAPNMTFPQAAETLRGAMSLWFAEFGDQIAEVILYQDYEHRLPGASTDREHYFGLLRMDGSDKGAYTAEARNLIRTSRPDGVPS